MTATHSGAGDTSWTIGNAISTSAAILFGHAAAFFGTALVASVPSVLFSFLVPNSNFQSIIDLIVGQIVTVTLVYGAMQALRGRPVSVGECLTQGMRRLGSAIGVALLSGICIGFAALLLVVPGLILLAMWAVAVPIAVIEVAGVTASLSRSQELTRDRRWRVLGAYIVAWLISIVGGAILGGIAGVVGGMNSILFVIALWAFVAFAQAFSACVVTTLYYFLRREKEGVDIEQIASVFD